MYGLKTRVYANLKEQSRQVRKRSRQRGAILSIETEAWIQICHFNRGRRCRVNHIRGAFGMKKFFDW